MGSPVGLQVLPANHLQHDLLSPWVHRPGACSSVHFWCATVLWGSFLCCFLLIFLWACYPCSVLNVLKDSERLYMLVVNCHHCRKIIWNAGILWEAKKVTDTVAAACCSIDGSVIICKWKGWGLLFIICFFPSYSPPWGQEGKRKKWILCPI